jgi:hypothetical protein
MIAQRAVGAIDTASGDAVGANGIAAVIALPHSDGAIDTRRYARPPCSDGDLWHTNRHPRGFVCHKSP